jgi:lysozyme
MTREITDAALQMIAADEGLRLTAYRDVAGVWTIGYGHTPASPGETVSQAQALALLRADVEHAADAVYGATHDVPTGDEQFSAMVSFAFNVGVGAFRRSSLLRLHRAGNFATAGDAFMLLDKAHVDGELVIVPGLLRRRGQERAMYLSQGAAVDKNPVASGSVAQGAPQPEPTVAPARQPDPDGDAEAEALMRDELAGKG